MAPKKKPDITEDDDDDTAETFSDRQREEMGKIMNAAIGAQLGRKLDAKIADSLTGAMSPILERLEKLSGAGVPAKTGDEGKEKAAAGAGAPDPEKAELRSRLDASDKRFAALEAERKQERDQTRAAKRDQTLREELTKIGIDPNRMRGAIAVIRDAVKIDDKTGELFYKAQRDGYEEDLDVSKGVAEWAASDEGKAYKAAPQQQTRQRTGVVNVIGGGEKREGGSTTKQATEARAQQKADGKAAALDKLSGAVSALIGGANVDMGGG